MLPPMLEHLKISGIRIGDASADLVIVQSPHGICATAENRHGNLDIVVFA